MMGTTYRPCIREDTGVNMLPVTSVMYQLLYVVTMSYLTKIARFSHAHAGMGNIGTTLTTLLVSFVQTSS
ncbi:hypothetical protein KSB_16010 [Ktedonobacter robiniae]|uniref:Uncharacterized protein n=1 Tax=Ktedonobacter robiniae TaxID=2778365 RepID=A0ABQ3UK63_9CHLR|nr:hypothetical protein KSB_16010 [Ktedonobacter robiniae]